MKLNDSSLRKQINTVRQRTADAHTEIRKNIRTLEKHHRRLCKKMRAEDLTDAEKNLLQTIIRKRNDLVYLLLRW